MPDGCPPAHGRAAGAIPGCGFSKDEGMRPLRHSYTNRTFGDGGTVVKCYQEPGALARSHLEHAVL